MEPLPEEKRNTYKSYGVEDNNIEILLENEVLGAYFDDLLHNLPPLNNTSTEITNKQIPVNSLLSSALQRTTRW